MPFSTNRYLYKSRPLTESLISFLTQFVISTGEKKLMHLVIPAHAGIQESICIISSVVPCHSRARGNPGWLPQSQTSWRVPT